MKLSIQERANKIGFQWWFNVSMHFGIMFWKSKIIIIKIRTCLLLYIWSQMLFSSLDTLFKVSKTTSPQKLFAYECITLYQNTMFLFRSEHWLPDSLPTRKEYYNASQRKQVKKKLSPPPPLAVRGQFFDCSVLISSKHTGI